ncbi:vesicular, overexpressed in cancer, prosurvival protein 1-like [Anneissia japonica]|uniref:vesicular, overexpressed in cancer, prosurvival protein 1-like n=1 Tax=Anneissia japonica TaxID=1529436 RepID=UPI0014255182|nr:vesicular, overexpressed in cancer, prosurvival protein 1-like [Anneissia japonica]
MYWSTTIYLIPLVTCWLITEVSGSECGDGYCNDYDQYCCDNFECCYYPNYSYWNLWYFWFVLIFVLMTCFGGCGYYRRRQVYLQTASGQRIPVGQTTYLTSGVQPVHHPYQPTAAPVGTFQSPPPYSEVTSKPNLYPKTGDAAYPPQAPYYQGPYYQFPTAATEYSNQPPPAYIPPQTNTTPQTENVS